MMIKLSRIVACNIVSVMLLIAPPAIAGQKTVGVQSAADLQQEMTLQRATQAVIWGIPAVSMIALRRGAERDLGATYNDVIYMTQPMAARHAFLTANNQTPYVAILLDTRSGPVVIEVPPASPQTLLFGTAVDAWQVPVVDVGPQGDDAGRGGKYLFLPPGHDQALPEGYLVNRPATYHVYIALRPVPVGAGTLADAVTYSKQIKVYPLAQAGNPAPTRYIDAFPRSWNTLPNYDQRFFADLATVITEEPAQPKDLAMLGMLSSLGISKGKPFAPDLSTSKTLIDAAKLGRDMLQASFLTPGKATVPYWPNSQWGAFNLSREQSTLGFPFVDAEKLHIDERAQLFYWATFAPKKLGKGTFYLTSVRDKSGRLLDGKSTYRLRVPANVPASQFWSIIAYDLNTMSFIAGAERVGLSSYDKPGLTTDTDGSTDLYFGPKAPKGKALNWLPTGKDFILMFRFYGPKPELFQKTWTMPDVERVK